MSQISRLRSAEIANGNLINADDIGAELDQLVSSYNANDTTLTSVATGTYTFSGVKTFSSTPQTNAIAERTADSGVTVDSVLLKDGMVSVAGTAGVNGQIGYASNQFQGYRNGSLLNFLMTGDVVSTANGPRGVLAGLGLTTGTDTLNDIDIAAGTALDSTNATAITLASLLTKRSDAAWAVGTGNGGMDTSTKPNSGTLHIWLIKRSDTGVVDALYSISATAPTMPTGYDSKALIGSRRTDSSGNIINMHQYGDVNLYDSPPALDVDVSNQSTTAVTRTLSTPGGRKLPAILDTFVSSGNGNPCVYFRNPDLTDLAPSITATPLAQVIGETGTGSTRSGAGQFQVITNTSSQITTRADAASTTVRIATMGWIDTRGRDA